MSIKSFSNFSLLSGRSYKSFRTPTTQHHLPPLHYLCNKGRNEDPESWESVRRWFHEHSQSEAGEAAALQSDFIRTTPLHLTCKRDPPIDVIITFSRICSSSFGCADALGRLPLHYACHYGASLKVFQVLIATFPDAISVADNKVNDLFLQDCRR